MTFQNKREWRYWLEDTAVQDASAFVEYLSFIPRTYTSHLTTICYSSSWGSDTLFWLHGSFSYKCAVVYLFMLLKMYHCDWFNKKNLMAES